MEEGQPEYILLGCGGGAVFRHGFQQIQHGSFFLGRAVLHRSGLFSRDRRIGAGGDQRFGLPVERGSMIGRGLSGSLAQFMLPLPGQLPIQMGKTEAEQQADNQKTDRQHQRQGGADIPKTFHGAPPFFRFSVFLISIGGASFDFRSK